MAWANWHRHGLIGHAVTDSQIYSAASRPALTRPVLERARLANLGVALPHVLPSLVLVALPAGLAAIICGYPLVAVFIATLIGVAYFPVAGILALPAFLIWAPRVTLAAAGGEVFFLRFDQAAVAGLLCHGVFHSRGRLLSPPGNLPFLLFLLALALSIIVGLIQGTLVAPTSAMLYLAQWVEFYGLYIATWSLGPRVKFGLTYAWVLPLVALAAYGLAEYAWPYYEVPGVRYRTFERYWFPGQANHAGGLFAFATATGLGLALNPRHRALGLTLALLSTLALVPTGSRSGVVAWTAGLAVFALIRVPALRWWAPLLGLLGLCALPGAWWQQIAAPGSSMFDRLVAWKSALSTTASYPLLGLGAGARHRSYYDNHYLMTLAESGMIGMGLLITLLIAMGRALAHPRPGADAWICAGGLAGLAALAVHGLATATFVVTLTAGPFFWYCGTALAPREDTS